MNDDLILDVHTLFGPTPPRGKGHPLVELQAQLAQKGVKGAVTLSTRAIYYDAVSGNRETHEACAAGDGFFLPADILDPRVPHPLDCIQEDSRIIVVMPATQQWPMHYTPFLYTLRGLVNTGRARTLWWETARAGDATAIFDILEQTRYPAPIILGGVSGLNLRETLLVAKRDTRMMICTDSLSGVGEIQSALEIMGPNRILFGSGAPICSISAATRVIEVANLPDEARKLILAGNVRELLRRPNSPAGAAAPATPPAQAATQQEGTPTQ